MNVQKLQMALHAKAKAEAGFRFYALYDKIHRDDILAQGAALARARACANDRNLYTRRSFGEAGGARIRHRAETPHGDASRQPIN